MFQQFLLAYANGNYSEALSLWDKHHKTFGKYSAVANEIIKLIDPPKPLF